MSVMYEMGNCVDDCIAHHSKELYIENNERYHQRIHGNRPWKCWRRPDTDERRRKAKRRKIFEKEFLECRMTVERNISDSEKVKRYKRATAAL